MKLPCSCIHPVQDSMYGKGIRVHNFARSGGSGKLPGYRCTVCKNVKQATGEQIKNEKAPIKEDKKKDATTK